MDADALTGAVERHRKLATYLARSGCVMLALAGFAVAAALFGLVAHIEPLARFIPGWPEVRAPTALGTLGAVAGFALLLAGRRGAGHLLLAVLAVVALVSMLLPDAERLPGGALAAYPGSVLLLLIAAIALVNAPGERQLPAARLLAAAAATLLFIALIGISFRLLLGLPPLVDISLPSLVGLLALTSAVVLIRPDAWLIERLTSQRAGAVITRRLLPPVLLLPLVIAWVELAGEGSGLLDSAFGSVLQTVLTMFALGVLVLWGARRLDVIDAQRTEAERAMKAAYAELDQRVADRTAALERANAALHESLTLLRGVAESTPDLIIVRDTAGRVILANPAQVKAIGRPEPEIIGRTDAEFLGDGERAARVIAADQEVIASGRVERVEETISTPDGTRTYLSTKSPLRDGEGNAIGVIAVSTDITERKRMENELREAQRFTQGLVETAPIVLYLFDHQQHRIVYATGMGLEALGYTSADMIAHDQAGLERLIHPDDLANVLDNLRRGGYAEGAIREVEFRCRARDGEWRWMHGRERPFEPGPQNRLLLGVTVDITDRKKAELERERLMAIEQRLRMEAERANRAKDEFLAIVSHELRSPLNALRGWGFLLGSAKTPDASLIQRATDAIKRNVDHQARLIDDLLDTSRIMSGKLNIERRPVNLVEVLQAAIEIVRAAAAAKRINIELNSERPQVSLEGDAARLQQIVVNLLSNAVKFTPEGGELKVALQTADGYARLAVTDTGAGIDPEFLPHVFDRFSQADTSTTRRHGGLGIGLALVRHLTELHGGRVHAQSEGVGKGSTFIVELPLPQAADAAPALTPADSASVGGLNGVHICALDDDPDAREVINLTLKQAGADVRSVATGAELVATLETLLPDSPPDVLLLDLAMPDEDGFTVLARVRALEARKDSGRARIPAIAVTAFTEVSRGRVIEHGFSDHVSKPIDPARLVAAVRRAASAAERATTT